MNLDLESLEALGCDASWSAQLWAAAAHHRDENAEREAQRTVVPVVRKAQVKAAAQRFEKKRARPIAKRTPAQLAAVRAAHRAAWERRRGQVAKS